MKNKFQNTSKLIAKFIFKIAKIIQNELNDFFSLKNGACKLPTNIL